MKRFYNSCTFLLFFVIYFNCNNQPQIQPIEETRIMMDTFVTITIYNNYFTNEQAQHIIEKAFAAMTRVDTLANNYNDSSKVSLLNIQAREGFAEVDPDLMYLIKKSIEVAELSDGAFDITVSPLIDVWHFDAEEPELPSKADIQQALQVVNYKGIVIDENRLKFADRSIKIDLGGIAKGFAVDEAMNVLVENGVRDALINAGGDIKAICSELTEGRRKVWIRHPRQREELYGYFQMDNGSVATSGDYERYMMIDSVRYHHILDPNTGYPAMKSISVTIQAEDATTADALATAVFVLGPEKGMKMINQLDKVEGVILFPEENGIKHIVSEGLEDRFQKVE
ncbi:FAD:protein FMN transferase [candidate division KSB1 bacterium]|nr:FAD:protein FMN transferase [candidate division KSB1 bacterium]